jgi:hypothetical protein
LLTPPGLRPVDIEYLQQLSSLTSIIILLAQTDLMSTEQITASKEQIHSQLKRANVRLFSFSSASPSDQDKQGIYAISSAAGSDHDTMDASLLMSPDYVQPLIPTELSTLVEQVFSPTGAAWLRHAAARKYISWRNANSPSSPTASSSSTRPPSLSRNQTMPPSLSLSSSYAFPHSIQTGQRNLLPPPPIPTTTGTGTAMGMGTPSSNLSSSYALARLADHAQREERLAQVRLANWAAELQRSLEREREEYARLARAERAVWLAERIGECVREGVVDPSESGTGMVVAAGRGRNGSRGRSDDVKVGRKGRRGYKGRGGQEEERQTGCRHRQDPLGLLEVADELRHKGLIALEVIGGLGVLGGLALWVTRHYLHVQGLGWVIGEWERFWYGPR